MTMEWDASFLKSAYHKAIFEQIVAHLQSSYVPLRDGQKPFDHIIAVEAPYKHRFVTQEALKEVLDEFKTLIALDEAFLSAFECKEKKDVQVAQPKGKPQKESAAQADPGGDGEPKRPIRKRS